MSVNKVIIMGRAITEPELRFLAGKGTAIAKVTIAVDREMSKEKKAEAQANGWPTADFINVKAWAGTAEYLAKYLGKGKRVVVEGPLETGSYKAEDGSKRYTTEVKADKVTIIDWASDNSGGGGTYNEADFQPIEDDEDIPF